MKKEVKKSGWKKTALIIGLTLLAVFIVLLIIGFLQSNSNSKDYYTHDYFKVASIPGWTEIPSEIPSSYSYIPNNAYTSEGISITITLLPKNSEINLDSLFEQGVETTKKIMPDFQIIESPSEERFGNVNGKKVIFTGTSNNISLEFNQVYGIKFNVIYTITYVCPIEKCLYSEVFTSLKNSFEAIEP